jgi:hypothetical protein
MAAASSNWRQLSAFGEKVRIVSLISLSGQRRRLGRFVTSQTNERAWFFEAMFSIGGSRPMLAARRALPFVDNSDRRIGRTAGSADNVPAEADISPLRRRSAGLVADHPGGPALLQSSLNMQWINDDVHTASPVVRREHAASLSHRCRFLRSVMLNR